MKKILLAVGVVAVILVVGLTGCNSGLPVEAQFPQNIGVTLDSQQHGIYVSGTGKVTITPDIAIITLGISSQSVSVSEAQSKAAEAMSKVMAALKGKGVADKDIQTQNFSIQQITRWDDKGQIETVIGYRVTNMVIAKIRDVSKAGTVIDAVAVAGGDLTRINGITFTVDKPEAYYSQARELAMKDAKAKAEQMANLAGVSLGKATSISESTYYPVATPVPIYKEAAGASVAYDTSISAGEMNITINVSVTYSID